MHEEDEDFSGAHWRGGGGGDRHPRHPHRRRSSSAGTQTPTKGLSELQSLVMAHADVPPVTHSPEVPAAAAAAATAPRARRSLATPTPTPTTKRKGRPSQQKAHVEGPSETPSDSGSAVVDAAQVYNQLKRVLEETQFREFADTVRQLNGGHLDPSTALQKIRLFLGADRPHLYSQVERLIMQQ